VSFMKTGWLIMLSSFALSGAGTFALAENQTPAQHSYRSIIDRNPFNIRPPQPPPPPPQQQQEQPKIDIYLTGVSSLLGPPKAFLKVHDQGSREPKYLDLGVDEKKDGIEVLEINDADRSVRIRSQGAEMLLTFETHAAKAMSAPAVAVAPNQRQPLQTAAARRGTPGAAINQPGTRTLARPTGAVPAGMTPPGAQPAGAAQPRIRNIPSRTLRVQPDQTGTGMMDQTMAQRYGLGNRQQSPPHQDLQHNLSPEEQVLMLELHRAANPSFPMPPTPGLPPELSGGAEFPGLPQ
jgi:hypothetical protein